MAIEQWSVAAATLVVGYDACQGQDVGQQGYERALTGYGCTGSTAAGDFAADIFIDDVKIGTMFNTATGVGAPRDHIIPVEARYIPSNSQLKIRVTDAANSNPVFFFVETERLE